MAQDRLNGFGKTTYHIEFQMATGALFKDSRQRTIVPIVQSRPYYLGTVLVFNVLHCERSQRGKETVGVGLMVDGIDQLGVGHRVSIMEHAS